MITVTTPTKRIAETHWAIQVVLRDLLGLDCEVRADDKCRDKILLQYGTQTLTLPNVFFEAADNNWLDKSTLPACPLAHWNIADSELHAPRVNADLPILYGTGGFCLDEHRNGSLQLDVFGSAFFMLSRYEELVNAERDSHDRFPASASVAFQNDFLNRPIIDEYVEVLWAAILAVWPNFQRPNRTFQIRVSHDVDSPSRYSFCSPRQLCKMFARGLLNGRPTWNALRPAWSRFAMGSSLHQDDPDNTFDWLMDVSERHNLKGAYYFISGRTCPARDAKYEIEHPAIRRIMRRIHERGHEIGLHPSYHTYLEPSRIVNEAIRLRKVCEEEKIRQSEWGGRMHYLRWSASATWQGWESAGMTYDSTLGYADAPGFRAGTCQEYQAFDLTTRSPLTLRVRPLVAMECSVMSKRYLGLGTSAEAFQRFVTLKNACRRVGGSFTLLWHNSQLDSPEKRELYQSVIEG